MVRRSFGTTLGDVPLGGSQGWNGDLLQQTKTEITIPPSNPLIFTSAVTHLDHSLSVSVVNADFAMAELENRKRAQTYLNIPSLLQPKQPGR
jgi:hypothetical protein